MQIIISLLRINGKYEIFVVNCVCLKKHIQKYKFATHGFVRNIISALRKNKNFKRWINKSSKRKIFPVRI